MLLQFCFSNYKSFKDEAVFDMRASGSNEYNGQVRSLGKDRVLLVAAIYGANASGKSNVFSAFRYMSRHVVNSLFMSKDVSEENQIDIPRTPFVLSSKENEPSEFEVYYADNCGNREKYYNYGFSIDSEGIVEEWLKTNSKTGVIRNKEYKDIFYRKRGEKTFFGSSISKYSKNLSISLEDKVLLVSLGAKLKVKELLEVRDWFYRNDILDCSDPISDAVNSRRLPKEIVVNPDARKKLVEFIHSFDKSIVDFEFEKVAPLEDDDEGNYHVFTIHLSSDGNNRVRIPFREESSGTIKMFALYKRLMNVLQRGGVFFSDELDIKIHPLLMRNIILTFADPNKNPNNAQLIFTTHNTIYMDMGLFRKDAIWFTEKKDNVSELYSLDDFVEPNGKKVRKDSNYEKNYLLGNYGAIPCLFSLVGEKHNET